MKLSIINIDPEILGGTPVFRGTRVPIQALFDCLPYEGIDGFLYGFPTVTREMVEEVLEIAAKKITKLPKKTDYENSTRRANSYSTIQEKNNHHFLLQQAANDPLFLADIEGVNDDFKHI